MIADQEIEKLSLAERLALISELWDSVSDEALPLPDAQRAELQRRLSTFERDKASGTTWEALKADLNARKP